MSEKSENIQKEINDDIGIGYTLATGKLFVSFSKFHKYAENLLGVSISHAGMTNSFDNLRLWERLREKYEEKRLEELKNNLF